MSATTLLLLQLLLVVTVVTGTWTGVAVFEEDELMTCLLGEAGGELAGTGGAATTFSALSDAGASTDASVSLTGAEDELACTVDDEDMIVVVRTLLVVNEVAVAVFSPVGLPAPKSELLSMSMLKAKMFISFK